MVNLLENIVKKSRSLYNTAKLGALTIITAASMNQALAQEGSGHITFNTGDDTEISENLVNAQAEKIAGDNIGTTYDLIGLTNDRFPFGPWITLSNNEFELGKDYLLKKNPHSEFNLVALTELLQNQPAKIFDMTGRQVAVAEPVSQSGNKTEIYANLSHLSNGTYIVQVGNNAIKFVKNSSFADGPDGISGSFSNNINSNSVQARNSFGKNISAKTNNQLTGNENYDITWDEIDLPGNSKVLAGNQLVEVTDGTDNELSIDMVLEKNETADIAFEGISAAGTPKSNVIYTLTKINNPSITYQITEPSTQAIFSNVEVLDNVNGDEYNLNIQAVDGSEAPTDITLTIFQDEALEGGEVVNGSQQAMFNDFNPFQQVTVKTINTTSLGQEANINVYMKNTSDDSVIEMVNSGNNGESTFSAPELTDVYFAVEGTESSLDIYKTSRGTYSVPEITNVSQQDTLLYYSVRSKPVIDGSEIDPVTLMEYKVSQYNTEYLRSSDEIFLEETPEKSVIVGHASDFSSAVGIGGWDFTSTTPFNQPTADQINQYQIFEPNRETFDGIIGVNGNQFGTSTVTSGKILDNGYTITFTGEINFDGISENSNHHELGDLLNVPQRTGITSRNPDPTQSVPITEEDAKSINYWYEDGNRAYNSFDNNKPHNYSQLETIENQ
ncbi:T9SS type A sorting domain-containing protein [Seonamhaeicola sediminis]|uniref:T9SS type A sorting domain-containing protein n=1 Tax=Seonamhaeicola sediminis TaxID=2528206 RepID=A0A562YC20_9FLAO|nr:T9SS type A sorting domain-containing protein [Seonamhaeicola sediminis]TWO31945.1 T9SS type A sorting domain-containing protein [Seonamhaeicola sediminis]